MSVALLLLDGLGCHKGANGKSAAVFRSLGTREWQPKQGLARRFCVSVWHPGDMVCIPVLLNLSCNVSAGDCDCVVVSPSTFESARSPDLDVWRDPSSNSLALVYSMAHTSLGHKVRF